MSKKQEFYTVKTLVDDWKHNDLVNDQIDKGFTLLNRQYLPREGNDYLLTFLVKDLE